MPNPNLGVPTGGFDATSGHSCVSTETYPPGIKIQVYQQDGSRATGPYTMIYLRYHEMSGQNELDITSCNNIVMQTEYTANGTIADGAEASDAWWHVGAPANMIGHEVSTKYPKAFACNTGLVTGATTATGMWGWFWCGGVCPWADISGLNGEITTDDALSLLKEFMYVEDTSYIVLGEFTPGESTDIPGGYNLVADA